MRRTQWVGLVAVLVLLVGAFLVGRGAGSSTPAVGSDDELVALRGAAGLAACPAGLGAALPELTVPCLGGGAPVALRSATTGLPTVVNVWGSWCGPCRAELPDFAAVSAKLSGRVAFVGVDTADKDRDALSLAAFTGLHYPSLVDKDGKVSAVFGSGTPKTVFLDASGRVLHIERGRVADQAALAALIAKHLGVQG